MNKFLYSAILLLICVSTQAQQLNSKKQYTRQDTLRGSLNTERTWWDVDSYSIDVSPDFNTKKIEGKTTIGFKVLRSATVMQLDLQVPMNIDRILWNGKELSFKRDSNAWHVQFPQSPAVDKIESIEVFFSGYPRVAVNPPWDGGWIFKKDKKGRPWMSVACQGLGASVWYPCKDHQSDEPDHGAALNITVPEDLVAVGNGKLTRKTSTRPGTITYQWKVVNPINTYNLVPYIGHYASWSETYQGEKGTLTCDYWVLDYELEKAKTQFKQVPIMLKDFEHWFGPYPFYEDGYKLVQSPHLGMEHQSAVAYGNQFVNGYLGNDLSGSGWGLKWDFIIVHESGHEWFANNITTNEIADMWVHEGFTAYSETLFTTSEYGVEAGNDYVIGTRANIENDIPIIGKYGVNQEGSGDMYYKGANMLHSIRNVINDDARFREILRGLNKDFYHQTVTTKQIEEYISTKSGKDFSKVFDQYLRTVKVPTLEYKINGRTISYRYVNCVNGFNMPLKVKTDKDFWINPTTKWQETTAPSGDAAKFAVDRNFYINVKNVTGN